MVADRSTGLELSVTAPASAVAVRAALVKRITTVGAAADADVQVAGLPAHWATVHDGGDGMIEGDLPVPPAGVEAPGIPPSARRGARAITLHVLATGQKTALAVGRAVSVAGVTVSIARAGDALAVDALADRLAAADSAEEALATLLDAVVGAAGADVGAVILAERGGFTVALARDGDGSPLADAGELLSDTIVRDVLGSGQPVLVGELAASRYGQVRSVVSRGLSSVVCLPLRLGGRTLGAIFVGARGRTLLVAERVHRDLEVVAALALPFLAQLRRRRDAPAIAAGELIGESPAIDRVRRQIDRVGPSDLSVLIRGPSGAGKEIVARALHGRSARAGKPLVAINCAAVAPTLLDSELFGYRKGAFSGAQADRAGLIEAAQGGVLFLDEVGDMPLPMQAALLRVLEQREVRRIGDTEVRAVDFRLIAATHRDLDAEVAAGRFREDLLFRIREVSIEVPPLRERGDDTLLLATVFLRQIEAQLGLAPHDLGADAIAALRAHAWPGNVREVKAAMRRAAILADAAVIHAADLQLGGGSTAPAAAAASASASAGASAAAAGEPSLGDTSRTLDVARDDFVRRYVQAAIDRNDGNREAAARELGIGVRTLYRYIA